MSTDDSVSRRSFLRTSGAVAAAATWTATSYAKIVGANERIRIGFVGAGGMGGNHLQAVHDLREKDNVEGVAVADCWKTRADRGAKTVEAPQSFSDYRKVLDIKDIDYVTVAVPEHWHSKITIDALDAGKAVYCEKPLTHTIPQGLAVAKKQKETGLAVQVGVQSTSDDCYQTARDAIREGVLGQVVQAQIEYVRRYDYQGAFRERNVKDDDPQPADLDWTTWLGHAPHDSLEPASLSRVARLLGVLRRDCHRLVHSPHHAGDSPEWHLNFYKDFTAFDFGIPREVFASACIVLAGV
jgi:hypothetical protein